MKLSICIVNYNTGRLLKDCLDSIGLYPPKCDFEILVVDNHSVDGSQAGVEDYPRVRLIQNQDNKGFAGGNNQAFQQSRGDYRLMLNPDTEVLPEALNELLACAEAHPRAGLISARLLNPDGSPQIGFNVRRFPGLGTAMAQLLLLDEVWPANPITRRAECRELDYDRVQPVEQPAASALLYRRSAWNEVGGFDEIFPNWYNDVDLCRRIRQAGWDILYCPTAQVRHYGGMGSAFRAVQSSIVENYRSQRLYYRKHLGYAAYVGLNTLIICGMLLRLAVLKVQPAAGARVHTRSQWDQPAAMTDAFRAVLVDTLRTWRRLPKPCLPSKE